MEPIDVSNQKHYTQFCIQPLVYIQTNKLNWCQGNIVKYACRYQQKDGVKDLYKALDYLKCLIYETETGKTIAPDELKKIERVW